MKIEKFVTGIISTNCYLVRNEETKRAVIIDPAACPSYLMSHIKSEGLQVEAILLTHGHFDHIMGIDDFRKEFPVPVYVHEADQETLLDASLNQSMIYTNGYTFGGATSIRDGQTLDLAGYRFQVIHKPGHTPGGVCYYVEEEACCSAATPFSRTQWDARISRTAAPRIWCARSGRSCCVCRRM